MILSLEKLNKYYGANHILKDITAKIEDNDRIGLIGINGAGKTTLLNIICSSLEFESGSKEVNRHATIGFLKQNSGLNVENTIYSELQNVFSDANKALEKKAVIEDEMSKISDHLSADYLSLVNEHEKCERIIAANDAYNIDVKINIVLNGMGFMDKPKDTPIKLLSGGEKTRLALCKLLIERPSLLILDEPTNHLDFKALIWLEDYLKSYKGAILIVSHDRFFLDALTDHIWDLEYGELTVYKGNYTKFLTLKEEARLRQLKEHNEQLEEIKKLEEYVAKNMVRASTAKSAKSKQKAIERMDIIDKPSSNPKPAKLIFEYDREPVKDVLDIADLDLTVGEGTNKKELFKKFNFHVFRGEKIAIIGENGIGKSSLLKVIQDLIPYESGEIEWGKHTKISYFEQENSKLNMEKTALDELWDRFPSTFEHKIRSVLGSVLISGEHSYKTVGSLSGGERAKLKFAIMSMEKGNVLIMDEPTNHLDLATKEVLDRALCDFGGTLLIISHDRYLLSKVPSKIVEFTQNGILVYNGNYNDYLTEQNKHSISSASAIKSDNQSENTDLSENKTKYVKSKEMRSRIAHLRAEKSRLEVEIKNNENIISALEMSVTTEEYLSDYKKLNEACESIEQTKNFVDELYMLWLEVSDELSSYDKE